jgi:hypothetical protein
MPRGKRRDETVRVRFTRDELAVARARAQAEGVPLSTYLRRLAVASRVAPAENEEKIRRALEALDALSSADARPLRESVRGVRKGWARGRR